MTLTVIGSSSKGNCYALQSSTETLILEAGCRLASFKKVLHYIYRPVVAVICSHAHGDHSNHVREFATLGGDIAGPQDVIDKYDIFDGFALRPGHTAKFGKFSVTPFEVYHDVPCFGYLIHHPEMGSLLFATDTFALPAIFKNVNHWLIEANYDDAILEENKNKGVLDNKQYKRILTSHMSIGNTIKNLQDGEADKSQTITLVHLSSRNSDEKAFKGRVEEEFGVPCYIAHKGLEVNLSKL